MTKSHATAIDPEKLNAFVGRALGDLAGAYGGVMVCVGHRLGLYKALAGAGPLTSGELAARTRCNERYIREWLGSQVAGGYVEYLAANDSYELTPEQAMVLADDESPVFMPTSWGIPASMFGAEERLLDIFRTGQGIAWGEHPERLHCGVAAFYRKAYKTSLVPEWLPALEGVVAKLEAGALVADVGCGHGHSTTVMAKAFPKSQFWGFDTHDASIAAARRNALEAEVKASFSIAKAADYPGKNYDLICFFDCFHDMGDPLAAAKHAAKTLAPDGTVLLVEPFANDSVGDNVTPIARMYYSASTLMCCAHAISEGGRTVLGAQAGEARLAELFRKAGFTRFRRALATPFNLVLEARL